MAGHPLPSFIGSAVATEEAYIRAERQRWTLGTATVQRVVALEHGRLLLKSFKNRSRGGNWFPLALCRKSSSSASAMPRQPLTGCTGPWKLVRADRPGSRRASCNWISRSSESRCWSPRRYVVYPGSSIIREWMTVANAGERPAQDRRAGLPQPGAAAGRARPAGLPLDDRGREPARLVGAEDRKARLPVKPRTFDSYEPFSRSGRRFPATESMRRSCSTASRSGPPRAGSTCPTPRCPCRLISALDVAAGDKLAFLVNMHGNIGWDTTAFDPAIAYDDGETHVASKEFSDKQGQNGWRYQYIEGGELVDLVYYPRPQTVAQGEGQRHGHAVRGRGRSASRRADQDAARVWTAPKAGRVRVTASVCNTRQPVQRRAAVTVSAWGRRPMPPGTPCWPEDTHEGLVIGWDYFGHWASSFQAGADGTDHGPIEGGRPSVRRWHRASRSRTPKAFVGLFRDDLDEAGNEVLDWQYRYLWDYTRDGWFPAIRMLGYWYEGDRLGPAGRRLDGRRPRPGEHVPQGLSRRRPDARHRRRRLPSRLGLVGSGRRLERPRFPRHRRLSPQVRHGAIDLRLPLHGRSPIEGRQRASRLGHRRNARPVEAGSGRAT